MKDDDLDNENAEDHEFIPMLEFRKAAKQVLSVTKEESDKQLANYRAQVESRKLVGRREERQKEDE